MYQATLALVEPALAAPTAGQASALFHGAMERLGATYLQTRLYRRPAGLLTSESHWDAGGFIARYARPGWIGSAGFDHICFVQNPLLDAIRQGRTRYRFSDFAPHGERRFAPYWDAFGEAGIHDALCATAYGPDRRIASLHLGFDGDVDGDMAAAVQLAGMALAERMLALEPPSAAPPPPVLTRREHDAIAFVAEGKTDWEIAAILGVAEATARFHVDNARRKLDATNRAHAVARFLALNGPF